MADDTMLTLGRTPEQDRYLMLGRAIARICPPGFEEARLEANLEDGSPMKLATSAEDGTRFQSDVGETSAVDIRRLLEDIRDNPGEQGVRGWRRCTVTLRKGGRFEMDVE